MKKGKPDYILLFTVGIIIFIGFFVLASAASVGSDIRFVRQMVIGFFPGIIIGFILFKTPLPLIRKWAPVFLLLNLLLLVAVLIPHFSEVRGGAGRWLSIGPISFQPTEFLKLTFVLYLSGWLIRKSKKEKKKVSLPPTETLLPFLLIMGAICGLLVKQPDVSTLFVIAITGFIIYFTAKTPLWHSIVIGLSGLTLFFVLIRMAPYRWNRIIGALNPDIDPLGINYHLRQFLITVGSGGITGLGIGMSQQKFGHLPKPATDSIFAILAEETGFVGSMLVVLLFFLFFWRGFLIAKKNKDGYSRLIALGICVWIFIQTSINIGVVIGLLPITGIPLPLISYGSSHFVAELAAIGILLNASQYKRK